MIQSPRWKAQSRVDFRLDSRTNPIYGARTCLGAASTRTSSERNWPNCRVWSATHHWRQGFASLHWGYGSWMSKVSWKMPTIIHIWLFFLRAFADGILFYLWVKISDEFHSIGLTISTHRSFAHHRNWDSNEQLFDSVGDFSNTEYLVNVEGLICRLTDRIYRGIFHDEKLYPTPFKFVPERWLDVDGNLLDIVRAPLHPNKVAFGFGRRYVLHLKEQNTSEALIAFAQGDIWQRIMWSLFYAKFEFPLLFGLYKIYFTAFHCDSMYGGCFRLWKV